MKQKTLHIALFFTAISYLIAGFHLHIHMLQPKTESFCSQNTHLKQKLESGCEDKDECSICLVLSLNPAFFHIGTDFSEKQLCSDFVFSSAIQIPKTLFALTGFDARAPPIERTI